MNNIEIPEELANAQEADWVREMQKYFNETGTYRAEDLDRLLGDPTKGVELFSNPVEVKNTLMMATNKSLYKTE